jgi:ribonuclease G
MKELYIDAGIAMTSIGVFEDGELKDSYIDEGYGSSISGNIYKGRIENLVPGLNAAFINIGLKKNAFMQLDNTCLLGNLSKGQEMLVQVIREESGDKGPRVTDRLSIPGRSCVLLINDKSINISSKIRKGEKRQELLKLGENLSSSGCGVIFRTEAFRYPCEDIEQEYKELMEKWLYAEKTSAYLKPPCLIYGSKDISGLVFREYIKGNIERIYTNSEELHSHLSGLCSMQGVSTSIELNKEPGTYIMMKKELNKLACRRLQLPSGGFVIVDRTEALVAFDVNTGNYSGRYSKEETILQTNLEACRAIAKSVRINNYSGIILIDFIDMELEESQSIVIEEMTRAMKEDSARHKVYGLTSLGLLEISRERKGKCLRDVLYSQSFKEEASTASLLKSLEEECIKRKLYYHEDHLTVRMEINIFQDTAMKYPDFFIRLEAEQGISVKAVPDDGVEGFQIVK